MGLDIKWGAIEFEIGGNHLLAEIRGCHIDLVPGIIRVVREFRAHLLPGRLNELDLRRARYSLVS